MYDCSFQSIVYAPSSVNTSSVYGYGKLASELFILLLGTFGSHALQVKS